LRLIFTVTIIIAFSVVMILYSGCASSGSTRYGRTQETSETRKSSIRFTSDDDTLIVDLNLDLKDPGDLPEDEPDIELTEIIPDYDSSREYSVPTSEFMTSRERMLMEIIKYFGTPYKYGGTGKDGIDCSAFTQNLFRDVLSYDLMRSARLQFSQGEAIIKQEDLRFGDLVFFNTRQRVRPGHVGIYIGERLFAHASTSKGVTISSMDHNYYSRRYMGARRVTPTSLVEIK
jgi:hypothetical protein